MNKKTFLAIIPARAGSKRLPNKNIKFLNGKPLIAWTIEAANYSKYINTTLVSTDSKKILDISSDYNAETPFLRPGFLALDESKSIDVAIHAIRYYKEELGREYEYIVFLQPTSPLRDSKDIDAAIEYLIQKNADAVISVCKMEHNPIWSNTLDKSKSMKNFLDKRYMNKRTQDLEDFYRINGAIYICKTNKLLEENTFFINDNIFAFEMEQEKSVDIDTKLDFIIAKIIIEGKSDE